MKLLPFLYQVGGSHLTHEEDASSYLVTSDPPVLIDCGTPKGLDVLQKNLKLIGFPASSLGLLIGTHCHYDHVGAARDLKNTYGVEFWLHNEDAPAVESGDPDLTAAGFFYGLDFPIVQVDRKLDTETRFELGEYEFIAVHTPGHTPGSISILVKWKDFTVLIAGDTLWGGYHPIIGSDIDRWHDSLARLEKYEFDVLVWGHSGSVVFGDAHQRLKEARESLGQYYVPWRTPMFAEHRYCGNPLAPGRVEYPPVP
jgi:hydroxyacylglutathione hydrolase